jgi:hypothetical protein
MILLGVLMFAGLALAIGAMILGNWLAGNHFDDDPMMYTGEDEEKREK